MSAERTKQLKGTGLSPGIAAGNAFIYQDILERDIVHYEIPPDKLEDEYARIREAIDEVTRDLDLSAQRIGRELDPQAADIFRAQQVMLEDSQLQQQFRDVLEKEHLNAEQVVNVVFGSWERAFQNLPEAEFRRYKEDLADLNRRLLRRLAGIHAHILEDLPEKTVIVARRLLPSDTVFLSHRATVGVVVQYGGVASHAALLTRELGIPAVGQVDNVLTRIEKEDRLLVDGDEGTVTVNPDRATDERFREKLRLAEKRRARARRHADRPATTRGGVTVQVMANITSRDDAEEAVRSGADGVGLYRLETFFLACKVPPSEDEILDSFQRTLAPVKDLRITIRLLDAGGDKVIPFLNLSREQDPFLGRRGVRLLMDYPGLTRSQLRAIIRLSRHYHIRIMVPMVTLSREMEQVRGMLHSEAADLQISPPPLGAMVETPAAALCASDIAAHCDFLSLGTNDLTQYTMAAGRENPHVSSFFQDNHPAVLRLIRMVLEGAGDKPVSLCGELGSRKACIATLVGMGIRTLSVAPPLIPDVKEAVRRCDAGAGPA